MVNSQRRLLLVAMLMLALSVASSVLLAAPPNAEDSLLSQLATQSKGDVVAEKYDVTGAVRYLHAADGSALTSEFAADFQKSPEEAGRAFFATYGNLFGIDADQLKSHSVKSDELGMTHVRFTQQVGGVPVFGADLIVHFNEKGEVLSVNGYTDPAAASLNTQVSLKTEEAAKVAAQQLAFTKDAYVSSSELVILKPGLITDQPSGTFLTHRMKVESVRQPELAKWVFVDAQTGEIRFSYPAVYDSRNRNTYNMKHGTNYNNATLARTESQGPVSSASNCTATDINNAHDYAGDTYDFYYNRFGRDSYNNAGATLRSYVCYGSNYQNAFWDGSKMTYGDGFAAADDVVSHELSHAVTEYASGLIYSYQSGALNESFSDIFGEAVDLTNGAGTDTSSVRWDMGEDIPGIGAIRDMMNPGSHGDPDKTTSSNYHCASSDNGGVHINSGVPNKAFALMVDGGSFNGHSITAIGMDKAVQIQYRTNEVYLTSSAKMLDNYNSLLSACADLYGASSSTCQEVRDALEAVEMNGPICGSGGATPTPGGTSPTATPVPSGNTYTGYLSGTGSAQYQPNGTYYYSAGSGTHAATLSGPSGTDFDLYLQKWSGGRWTNVANSLSSSSNESISYYGSSGYYVWRVYSYSGSGSYTLTITGQPNLQANGFAADAPDHMKAPETLK